MADNRNFSTEMKGARKALITAKISTRTVCMVYQSNSLLALEHMMTVMLAIQYQ
jgi:hypothetical protein